MHVSPCGSSFARVAVLARLGHGAGAAAPRPPGRRLARGLHVLVGAVVLGWIVSCGAERPRDHPLDSVAEVVRLSPEELKRGEDVALTGVVTRFDSRLRLLIVQDETGGILVSRTARGEEIAPGETVSVRGFSGFEGFSPVVVKATIEPLGPGRLPPAVPADAKRLFLGEQDFRIVEIECRIRRTVGAEVHRYELEAELAGRPFRVSGIGDWTSPLMSLVGARVRVRGIPITTYSPSGSPHSLQLLVAGGPETLVPLSGDADAGAGVARLPGEGRPAPDSPDLTRVGQVKALTNSEAARGHPVRLRVTVTNWDLDGSAFFAQDETAAVYVVPVRRPPPAVAAGDRVEIGGHTASGAFAPVVRADHVTVVGHGPLPPPRRPLLARGMSARDENTWAELEGVVEALSPAPPGTTHLHLESGHTSVLVVVRDALPLEKRHRLVNTRVRVRGTFAALFSADGRLTGLRLLTPSFDEVDVLEVLEGDTFDDPARPVGSLRGYNPGDAPLGRVKVQGQVTYAGLDGVAYLEDETGGIRLEDPPNDSVRVGDIVEAVGALTGEGPSTALSSVQVRPSEEGRPGTLGLVTAADAQSGLYDARLLRVEGFLRSRHQSYGDRIFELEAGRVSFTALLEHPQAFPEWDSLREGALLRLTGVCDVHWSLGDLPPTGESFRLLLRSPADILVVRSAPWWTLRRAMAAAASLLGALLVAALWAVTLRRRVAVQTGLITQQMEERHSLEVQLRHSQRLEGIGRLAGGVAHDFNNLLTVIGAHSDLLLRQLSGQEKARGRVKQIKKAGEAAAALTRQLLAVSRQQILRPVVVDLNDLVNDLDEMLRRLIGEDVELVTVLSSDRLPVLVDPGQIGQVVMNLAANARDAMPKGGVLTLKTASVFLDEGYVARHAGVSPGNHALVSVSDTGVGIDEETCARIFDPFFTTKDPGEGTGLGLATAFGVVRQSGGHIWVYSEPGHGTTFKVYLPSATGQRSEERSSRPVATERGNGETILVVEDNTAVRQLAAETLSELGYAVLGAPTAEDALSLARDHAGRIDLLLTDVVLPGMNGRQLSDRLVELRPGLRTLFASGYPQDVIAQRGVLASGINFLSKPYSPADLGLAVRAALERQG